MQRKRPRGRPLTRLMYKIINERGKMGTMIKKHEVGEYKSLKISLEVEPYLWKRFRNS